MPGSLSRPGRLIKIWLFSAPIPSSLPFVDFPSRLERSDITVATIAARPDPRAEQRASGAFRLKGELSRWSGLDRSDRTLAMIRSLRRPTRAPSSVLQEHSYFKRELRRRSGLERSDRTLAGISPLRGRLARRAASFRSIHALSRNKLRKRFGAQRQNCWRRGSESNRRIKGVADLKPRFRGVCRRLELKGIWGTNVRKRNKLN